MKYLIPLFCDIDQLDTFALFSKKFQVLPYKYRSISQFSSDFPENQSVIVSFNTRHKLFPLSERF